MAELTAPGSGAAAALSQAERSGRAVPEQRCSGNK